MIKALLGVEAIRCAPPYEQVACMSPLRREGADAGWVVRANGPGGAGI